MHGTWATWQQLYLFDSLAWSSWAHSNGSLDHIKWWNCFRWRSLQYLCSWRLSSLVGIAIRIGTNFVGCTEDIDVSMKNLVSLGWWVVLGIFTVVSCFQVPWHFFFAPLSLMLFKVCSMHIQPRHLLKFYLSRWPRGFALKRALFHKQLWKDPTFRSELLVDFGHYPDLQANIRQACKCLVKWMLWITLCMSARGLLKCPSHKDASLCVSWLCKW